MDQYNYQMDYYSFRWVSSKDYTNQDISSERHRKWSNRNWKRVVVEFPRNPDLVHKSGAVRSPYIAKENQLMMKWKALIFIWKCSFGFSWYFRITPNQVGLTRTNSNQKLPTAMKCAPFDWLRYNYVQPLFCRFLVGCLTPLRSSFAPTIGRIYGCLKISLLLNMDHITTECIWGCTKWCHLKCLKYGDGLSWMFIMDRSFDPLGQVFPK